MVVKINENYLKLKSSYLFVEVARRETEFRQANPDADIIKMGIGDVTKPLVPAVVKAFHDAVDEMGDSEKFMGYGPEQGYEFLANAIIKNDYEKYGVSFDASEVFISDGAKCDTEKYADLYYRDYRGSLSKNCYHNLAFCAGSSLVSGTWNDGADSGAAVDCRDQGNEKLFRG